MKVPVIVDYHAVGIKAMSMEEPLIASARLTHPALRRMTWAWALIVREPED